MALLGKTISSRQAELLKSNRPNKPIIIALDGEAHAEAEDIAETLGASGRRILLPSCGCPAGRDPADLTVTEIWDAIRSQSQRVWHRFAGLADKTWRGAPGPTLKPQTDFLNEYHDQFLLPSR